MHLKSNVPLPHDLATLLPGVYQEKGKLLHREQPQRVMTDLFLEAKPEISRAWVWAHGFKQTESLDVGIEHRDRPGTNSDIRKAL